MSTLKKEIMDAYNIIAYDYEHVRKKPWHVLQEFFKATGLLENRGTLLDIGCGNGRHIFWLNVEGFDTYGVDISKNLIQIAKAKITANMEKKPSFVVSDSTHLPFRSSSFDIAVLVALLHHLPSYDERYKTLEEASRVLKEGGNAVVTVWRLWQRRFLKYVMLEFFRRIIGKGQREFGDIFRRWRTSDKKYEVYRFYHLFRCKEIKELVKKTQLKIVHLKKMGGKSGKENIFAYLEKRR